MEEENGGNVMVQDGELSAVDVSFFPPLVPSSFPSFPSPPPPPDPPLHPPAPDILHILSGSEVDLLVWTGDGGGGEECEGTEMMGQDRERTEAGGDGGKGGK